MKINKKLLLILLTLFLLVSLMACSSDDVEDNITAKDEEKEEEIKELPSYNIESIQESHIGPTKRYVYHVVVEDKPNKSDLLEIGKEVVEKAKKETPFNALMVGFYDYPEYIGSGFILGKIEYVPNGDWGDAREIDTGDYESMELIDLIEEKDWDLQLTQEEVECWHLWNESYFDEVDLKNDNDDSWDEDELEDEITQSVASQLNLSIEEVNNILDKQLKWMMSDLE